MRRFIRAIVCWCGIHEWVDSGVGELELGGDPKYGPRWYKVQVCLRCRRLQGGNYDDSYNPLREQ